MCDEGIHTPPGRWLRAWRMLWAAPCSLVGLLLGLPLWAGGGRLQRIGPTLEISAPPRRRERPARWPRLPFGAITFGHVIIGRSEAELTRLRRHERVHVRQYERLGVLFFVAYPAASLWAALRGRPPYRDNAFEVEARAAEGVERDDAST